MYFEFKWLSVRMKKGAVPTIFENSEIVANNNPVPATIQAQTTCMLWMWKRNLHLRKNLLEKAQKKAKHILFFQNILIIFQFWEKKIAFLATGGGGGDMSAKNASFFYVLD